MKLIDKSALVAEIERRKQVAFGWMETAPNNAIEAEFELCDDILSFIDTLEVKEVDLEKHEREINIIIDILDREEHNGHLSRQDLKDCVLFLKLLQKSL